MKEHSEWFEVSSGNTNEGDFEHVGIPDNGELPGKLDMRGDSGVAPGTVY